MQLLQLSNNFSASEIRKVMFCVDSQIRRRIFENPCLLEVEREVRSRWGTGCAWVMKPRSRSEINFSANSDDLSMLLQCGNRSKSHGCFEPSVPVAKPTSL